MESGKTHGFICLELMRIIWEKTQDNEINLTIMREIAVSTTRNNSVH